MGSAELPVQCLCVTQKKEAGTGFATGQGLCLKKKTPVLTQDFSPQSPFWLDVTRSSDLETHSSEKNWRGDRVAGCCPQITGVPSGSASQVSCFIC